MVKERKYVDQTLIGLEVCRIDVFLIRTQEILILRPRIHHGRSTKALHRDTGYIRIGVLVMIEGVRSGGEHGEQSHSVGVVGYYGWDDQER